MKLENGDVYVTFTEGGSSVSAKQVLHVFLHGFCEA